MWNSKKNRNEIKNNNEINELSVGSFNKEVCKTQKQKCAAHTNYQTFC